MILQTINLSHKYSSNWAIRDINIQIGQTGIVGLLGANGSGKSTTLNIICGTLNQTAGDVFIDGVDLRKEAGWVSSTTASAVHRSYHRRIPVIQCTTEAHREESA